MRRHNCILIFFFLRFEDCNKCVIQPTQFQDFAQLFSLVIYCECSKEHLLRDKWCRVKICLWTHWHWCWQPFLKVMTSRHQVTDIWMFGISVELSRHFHLSSLCFDAAVSLLPLPLYIVMLQRVVHKGWAGQKVSSAERWSPPFFLSALSLFVVALNYL